MSPPRPTIPCPSCGSAIEFDPMTLIKEGSITCSACGTVLTLAEPSKKSVESAMEEIRRLAANR